MSEESKFKEQVRYIFAGTVIASFLSLQSIITSDRYLYWLLLFSTIFSALYLLMSAASLRYFGDGGDNFLFFGEKLRMATYDVAINIYGTGLIFGSSLVITKKVTHIFMINSSKFWIVQVLSISILLLLGVIFRHLNIWIDKRDNSALFWRNNK